jgi:hypothetical protein
MVKKRNKKFNSVYIEGFLFKQADKKMITLFGEIIKQAKL